MKKGKTDGTEKKVLLSDKQPPAVPAKLDSSPKKAKSQKAADTVQLPVLVELAYTASAIVLILVSLMVVLISLLTGASLLDLVIRTGVTTLVTGSILMLISWQISVGALKASQAEQEDNQEKLGESQASKSDSISEAQ